MTDGVRISLSPRPDATPAKLICPEHDMELVWEQNLARFRCPFVPCYIGISKQELQRVARWLLDGDLS